MKAKLTRWVTVIIAAFAFVLCTGSAAAQCVASADGSGIQIFPLIAGKNTAVGGVAVRVEGDQLKIDYGTTDGWVMGSVHLWVGSDLATLPVNKAGNPVPGQFPYKSAATGSQTTCTFSIPLAGLNFSCPGADKTFYLAAHAEVHKMNSTGSYSSETAWSLGSRISPKGNWGTYSAFTLTCVCGDDEEPPPPGCETAFAAIPGTSTCFLDAGFNRWGWTTPFPDPGAYGLALFAGAAQCDVSKGPLAGLVSVTYDGSLVEVAISTLSGFTLSETHLYVGNGPFPVVNGTETVAPGQYPYSHENLGGVTSDSYTVPATGAIYVIVHAVTCATN